MIPMRCTSCTLRVRVQSSVIQIQSTLMQNSVDYCATKNSRLLNVVPNADAQATTKDGVYNWHPLNTGNLRNFVPVDPSSGF